MSTDAHISRFGTVVDRVRAIGRGSRDPRLRATWRVLLAIPVIMLSGAAAVTVAGRLAGAGMLATGLVQAGVFAALLVGMARYVDRRRLSEYGFSASPRWLVDAIVGFAAVLVAQGAWYGLGTSLGYTNVEVSMTAPQGSVLLGLGTVFLALAVNAWVQDTVFFGLVLKNAAEGLRQRALDPDLAVLGAWLVGILFFVVLHGNWAPWQVLYLAAGGAVMGMLYVHTGELALPIGVHLGSNFGGNVVFPGAAGAQAGPSIFQVTGSLPGVLGTASEGGIPQIVLVYLLTLAWLEWRRGGVSIATGIARWTGR